MEDNRVISNDIGEIVIRRASTTAKKDKKELFTLIGKLLAEDYLERESVKEKKLNMSS